MPSGKSDDSLQFDSCTRGAFFFLSFSHSDGMEITGNEQRQARAEQITMDQVSTRAEGALKGGKLLMWLFLRVWRPAWRKFR